MKKALKFKFLLTAMACVCAAVCIQSCSNEDEPIDYNKIARSENGEVTINGEKFYYHNEYIQKDTEKHAFHSWYVVEDNTTYMRLYLNQSSSETAPLENADGKDYIITFKVPVNLFEQKAKNDLHIYGIEYTETLFSNQCDVYTEFSPCSGSLSYEIVDNRTIVLNFDHYNIDAYPLMAATANPVPPTSFEINGLIPVISK